MYSGWHSHTIGAGSPPYLRIDPAPLAIMSTRTVGVLLARETIVACEARRREKKSWNGYLVKIVPGLAYQDSYQGFGSESVQFDYMGFVNGNLAAYAELYSKPTVADRFFQAYTHALWRLQPDEFGHLSSFPHAG